MGLVVLIVFIDNTIHGMQTAMVVHVRVKVLAEIMCESVEVHLHVATPTQPRSTMISCNASLVLVTTYVEYACSIIVVYMSIPCH